MKMRLRVRSFAALAVAGFLAAAEASVDFVDGVLSIDVPSGEKVEFAPDVGFAVIVR